MSWTRWARIGSMMVICAALPGLGSTAVAAQDTDFEWYGYVKLDASWDEGPVNAGNFARWVLSPEAVEKSAHFNMTARQTRVGFRARSERGSASLLGRWESDFYGGGAENKNSLQVRHAYVEVSWPSGWSLIAGQTSDVVSPLVPTTLNYVVAWWSGNVGYRRPQLRVTKRTDLGGATLTLVGAAARTIGDDFGVAGPGDSGADSGVPTFQGRVALSVPLGSRPLTVGTYMHRGEEDLGDELTGDPLDIATSSWGVDLSLPLGPLTLSGEAWTGSNLDDYFGGIAQGIHVDETAATGISATGGWAELAWRGPSDRVQAGFGIDDPDDEDLDYGFRSRNFSWWGSAIHDYGAGLQVGLELSWYETQYIDQFEGTSYRVQGSVIYSF